MVAPRSVFPWRCVSLLLLSASPSAARQSQLYAQREEAEVNDDDLRRRKLITYDDGAPVIDGEYIVFFRTDVKADEAIERIKRAKSIDSSSFAIEHTYSVVLNAAAVSNVTDAGLEALLADESIDFVEPDRPTYLASAAATVDMISPPLPPWRPQRQQHDRSLRDDAVTQNLPGGDPWGLDRLDSPARTSLDSQYQYRLTGAGVDVFVFDTGIRLDHSEFSSRVRCGLNLIRDEDCSDSHGHGTHVAGIIGGTTFGVAKQAQMWSIKTLDKTGGGKVSLVIAGLEFVLLQRELDGSGRRPSVVNLSLDSGFSNAFNTAVDNAVHEGVVVVMAGGNEATDACTKSPSSAAQGISVGAIDKESRKIKESNYGTCIDVFAYVFFCGCCCCCCGDGCKNLPS
jgi:subtilisin family serine protease